ncbi:MAG: SDR family oxidoreductase [Pseudomonadota bacterium]
MAFKAALVTGAGVRIGREIAVMLGGKGIDVAVHYAGSADGAAETVGMIEAAGGSAVAIQADLLSDTQIADLVGKASDALGQPLDILVNNASIFEYDNIDTATFQSWDRHIATNLKAPLFLSQAFARQAPKAASDENGEPMAQAMILNMIDQRVRSLTPEFMTYTLAKSALWTLTQTSAQALAPDIRVNAIGPGPTVQGHRQSTEHFSKQRENTVLKRGSSAPEIAEMAAFLLSAPAITGQLFCLDGGQHLTWETPDVLGVE